MNLCEALLDDYMYGQNGKKYILGPDGWFKKAKINDAIEHIQKLVTGACRSYDKTGKIMAPGCVYIDQTGLADVLSRYSRDVFGQKRLEFQIEDLVSDEKRKGILKKNLPAFGCRTSSSEPYFYRRIGYLFYWFSLIKPFHLDLTRVDITQICTPMKFYFNEYMTYALLRKVVEYYTENGKKYRITIHDDEDQFWYFLYDLHYRDLSRSSLEFFLKQFIIPVSTPSNVASVTGAAK